MSRVSDRALTARMSLALLLANIRYWSTVASLVRPQLEHWTRHAERIPDPTLKEVALANLREEGFNAQATATLATLAPRRHRKSAVEAIIALQVLYDYLDSLVEIVVDDPLRSGRQLYQALADAVVLNAEPSEAYYSHTPWSDDGDYLHDLVTAVRKAVERLPSRAAIALASEHAAERCAAAQIHAHAVPALGSAQLERWAIRHAIGTGLQWREFLAGAVSSGLALHALIALAADPHASHEQANAIDDIYLSVCALTTLLDGLIDYEQDMHSMGHPGYIRYYESQDALAQGLRAVISHSTARARTIPHGAYHLMTLVGVVAYYASAPTASSEFALPVTAQIRRELRPLITPTLAVMRAWRIAKRARAAISSEEKL